VLICIFSSGVFCILYLFLGVVFYLQPYHLQPLDAITELDSLQPQPKNMSVPLQRPYPLVHQLSEIPPVYPMEPTLEDGQYYRPGGVVRQDSGSTAFSENEKENPFRRQYDSSKQFRRLLIKRLLRWSLNIVYMAMMVMIFWAYSRKGVLNRQTKRVFNALFTGLTLLLGFNVVASFKGMATIFRWRVLASARYGGHTAEEVRTCLHMYFCLSWKPADCESITCRWTRSFACPRTLRA
jgi:hypothetical protein